MQWPESPYEQRADLCPRAGQGSRGDLTLYPRENTARAGCRQAPWSLSESQQGFSNEELPSQTLPVFSVAAAGARITRLVGREPAADVAS